MPKHLPTAKVKELFGEFSHTDLEGGRIKIDPAWVAENLVEVEVPQLAGVTSTGGRITFHRKGAEQLRNAFEEVGGKGWWRGEQGAGSTVSVQYTKQKRKAPGHLGAFSSAPA